MTFDMCTSLTTITPNRIDFSITPKTCLVFHSSQTLSNPHQHATSNMFSVMIDVSCLFPNFIRVKSRSKYFLESAFLVPQNNNWNFKCVECISRRFHYRLFHCTDIKLIYLLFYWWTTGWFLLWSNYE